LENLKMVSENVKIESANKKMGDWSIDRLHRLEPERRLSDTLVYALCITP